VLVRSMFRKYLRSLRQRRGRKWSSTKWGNIFRCLV